MLRLAALVLLLVNLLLLALHAGWVDASLGRPGAGSQREPERLARQIQPQALQLLPAAGPTPATPVASAASAASATSAPAAPASPSAPAAAPEARACLETGPLDPPGLAEAQRGLQAAGLATSSWQVQALPATPAFLVYMGRFGDSAALLRKQTELRELKVPAVELKDAPGLQPGLSLGRHPHAEAADAALAGLAQRGIRTARVVPAPQRPGTTALLRLPAADAALRERLAGQRLPGGLAWRPCGVDASPAKPSGG